MLRGESWGRRNDTLGVAGVVNGLSGAAREYFSAGGRGILIGDGALSYKPETIVETYYSLRVNPRLSIGFDYQYLRNPAHNADRLQPAPTLQAKALPVKRLVRATRSRLTAGVAARHTSRQRTGGGRFEGPSRERPNNPSVHAVPGSRAGCGSGDEPRRIFSTTERAPLM